MATIKDVAQLAHVSVATVSRYLNNSGYVGVQAKVAIEQAIRELNYKPNQVARSLSTKQVQTIGLIVPDITNPFFPEVARAIEDTALKEGYTVILCNSDEQATKELHYIETLQQKYIAGFIIATNQLQKEQYHQLNVPIVLLDRVDAPDLPTVASQNEEGAKLAVAHLVANEAKHIAFFSGPRELLPVQQRLQGFTEQAQLAGIDTSVAEMGFHFNEAQKVAYEVLRQNPTIDAVFASSDTIAIGVLKAAHELGRQVPEDLQVVGFDGIAIGEMVTPGLTTVAQNIYALGETAAHMLIAQIKGQTLSEKHVTVAPKLIVRGTTKGART